METLDILKRNRDRAKIWYYANHEVNKVKNKIRSRSFRASDPKRAMLNRAKNRAKVLNLPFNIEITDIEIPKMCPILKIELISGRHSPSLDRIKPELGYVKGNIWVISSKANVMKNDATLEELKEFSNWVNSYQP